MCNLCGMQWELWAFQKSSIVKTPDSMLETTETGKRQRNARFFALQNRELRLSKNKSIINASQKYWNLEINDRKICIDQYVHVQVEDTDTCKCIKCILYYMYISSDNKYTIIIPAYRICCCPQYSQDMLVILSNLSYWSSLLPSPSNLNAHC